MVCLLLLFKDFAGDSLAFEQRYDARSFQMISKIIRDLISPQSDLSSSCFCHIFLYFIWCFPSSFVLPENAPLPFMGHSKFVALMVRTEKEEVGGAGGTLLPILNSLKTPIKDHNVTELDLNTLVDPQNWSFILQLCIHWHWAFLDPSDQNQLYNQILSKTWYLSDISQIVGLSLKAGIWHLALDYFVLTAWF